MTFFTSKEAEELLTIIENVHPPSPVDVYRLPRPPETVEAVPGVTAWPAPRRVNGAVLRIRDMPPESPDEFADLAGRQTAQFHARAGVDLVSGDVMVDGLGRVWLCGPPRQNNDGLPHVLVPLYRVPDRHVPQALRP